MENKKKNIVLWLVSIIICIFGLLITFISPNNLAFQEIDTISIFGRNLVIENIIFGITLLITSIIVSPTLNIIYNKKNKKISILEKVVMLLLVFLNNYVLVFGFGQQIGIYYEDYIATLIGFALLIIILFLYSFLLCKCKNIKILKIINISLLLIVIVSFFSIKIYYINKSNQVYNNYFKFKLDDKMISENTPKDKYYFEDISVDNLYDSYEIIRSYDKNIINLKDLTNNRSIHFSKNSDSISKLYYNLYTNNFINDNSSLVSNFLTKNKIKSELDLISYFLTNKKNIFNLTSDIYYGYYLLYYSQQGFSGIQKIIYKDYNVYLWERTINNKDIYRLYLSYKENNYIWYFYGDFTINDIYEFISTMNIETEPQIENSKWLNIKDNLKKITEIEKQNYNYTLNCVDDNNCVDYNLTINDNNYYVGQTADILFTEKYLIIKDDGGDGFQGKMKIIDKDGKELFNTDYIGTLCPKLANSECVYFGIKGNNDIIYYIDSNENNYYLKAINLNGGLRIDEIEQIYNYVVAG